MHLAHHLILELYDCDSGRLNDVEWMKHAMTKAAEVMKARIVETRFHEFSPQGFAGVLLLAESHLSMHTWPEHGYAAVDIFMCGSADLDAAARSLIEQMGASRWSLKILRRGALVET